MSKIKSLRSRTVRVPLDHPTAFSTRSVLARDYTLVEVATDDDHTGIGFCYSGNAGGTLVTGAVRELLAPVVLGQDPYRVEGLWQEMYQEVLLHGRAGTVMRALSAIDIALWDRNARAAGLPLYKYLGASVVDTVPAYASGGYYLEGKTPEMLGEELAAYVAMGFKAVKINVGRLGLNEEEARVAAV
ncbi:MAG: mandelate racemase/muconate lactonizing enzyme family protein, partial [Woeseiaceae bacterium]